MPRKTIKKPSQKSPKTSRRRSEANRPPTSSSSSDPSLATLAAERAAARRERSLSKSKSKTEQAALSKPLEDMPGVSDEQPGVSFARPDSPRTPPRAISPKRKPRTSRSPFKTKSPLATEATASATPPPKKKISKALRGPSSNLLAEGRPGSFSGTLSRSIPFDRHLERLRHYSSINAPLYAGPSTSQTPSRDRKAYVFVPNTDRVSQSALGRMMSQLYGYLGTLQEDGTQFRRVPSADEQSSTEESKKIRVLDIRKQPIKEEMRAERDAEREAEQEAAKRETAEHETESLVRVLSNLSAPSSSPEPKRKSPPPKVSKGVFQYNPDVIKRRHSADADVGAPSTRGGSSHVAPDFGRGKSRVKFALRRVPDKARQQTHKTQDTDRASGSGIQMIELGPIQGSNLARRRLSRNEDPPCGEKEASSSQEYFTPQEGSHADSGVQDMELHPKLHSPAGLAAGSPQPGPSGYREPRVSVDSEEGQEKTAVDSVETPPLSYSYVSQELSESDHRPIRSEYESTISTVTSTGNFSGSVSRTGSRPQPHSIPGRIPTPDVLTCDWRQCYREFIGLFNRQSATVTEFFQHLSDTLVRRIREPGTRTRRYFLVTGLSMWMLVQDFANDYWFFCGGRDEENDTGEPPRMMDPERSLQYELGSEPTPPAPPPQRPTVRNICSEAARRVASGARTIRRRRASSREPQRTPEELEANIQRLLTIIRARTPTGPIEPRRDFTAADCPFISLSFQNDIPENPASAEATDEAAGGEAADEAAGAAGDGTGASRSNLKVPAEKQSDDESHPEEDKETKV